MKIETPHIIANEGDFAKTVLMPGDPLRAQFIAEKYFENPVLISNIRGICAYSGMYKGKKVSVMASGMGMPSMGIYSHELFTSFGVERIIRIGTAGSIQENLKIKDIILVEGASTNSNYMAQYDLDGTFSATANYELLDTAVHTAENMQLNVVVGNILTSDTFYTENAKEVYKKWSELGILAVEMEAAALYINAAKLEKKALAICTVSDNIITGEESSAEERQVSFTQMMELALNVATND